MPQTKDTESQVEGFSRSDGRLYFYDPNNEDAWLDADESDFVEVRR